VNAVCFDDLSLFELMLQLGVSLEQASDSLLVTAAAAAGGATRVEQVISLLQRYVPQLAGHLSLSAHISIVDRLSVPLDDLSHVCKLLAAACKHGQTDAVSAIWRATPRVVALSASKVWQVMVASGGLQHPSVVDTVLGLAARSMPELVGALLTVIVKGHVELVPLLLHRCDRLKLADHDSATVLQSVQHACYVLIAGMHWTHFQALLDRVTSWGVLDLGVIHHLRSLIAQCVASPASNSNANDSRAASMADTELQCDIAIRLLQYMQELWCSTQGAGLVIDDDALLMAARCGHSRIVNALIAKGADVQMHRNEPLRVAVTHSHTAVMRLVLNKGASQESLSSDRVWPSL